jgi:hypothetical protein
MRLLKAVGRGFAFLLVALCAVAVFWSDIGQTSELRAAVTWNQLELQLDRLHCLSVDPRGIVFNERQYPSERLVSTIGAQLAIPQIYVNAEAAKCPWDLSLSGEKRDIFAVRYRDEIARYVMSADICERLPDGTPNPNRCLSKNVYVFNRSVAVDAIFLVALTGLARKQTSKWEAFQVEGAK